MIKNDILYCSRIYKETYNDTEKGDIDFIHEKDQPDIIVNVRVFLNQVVGWQEYKEAKTTPYFNNKDFKTRINLKDTTDCIIILSLEEVDKIMEDYLERKVIKHN